MEDSGNRSNHHKSEVLLIIEKYFKRMRAHMNDKVGGERRMKVKLEGGERRKGGGSS